MMSENPAKRAAIKLAMPTTVQFIEKQLAISSGNPGNSNSGTLPEMSQVTPPEMPQVTSEPSEARLMEAMGYDAVCLNPPGHMAVGIYASSHSGWYTPSHVSDSRLIGFGD